MRLVKARDCVYVVAMLVIVSRSAPTCHLLDRKLVCILPGQTSSISLDRSRETRVNASRICQIEEVLDELNSSDFDDNA